MDPKAGGRVLRNEKLKTDMRFGHRRRIRGALTAPTQHILLNFTRQLIEFLADFFPTSHCISPLPIAISQA
ncbi:hypothetical protein AB3X93_01135 [Paraburkholderia sp. BR14262]|uniref:hypothetical protein n=1 Tax=Paraburkholderia sp. BR14263 TaxID=3237000 RepID=UPI0034CD34B6